MSRLNQKYIRMTTEPVRLLVCRLAVPTIISMLVTALYNIADTFFVGRIGTQATAGVGLVFPVMTIMQAFGFFFGQGSGNYISRKLGSREMDKAETMAATGNLCALLFGAVFAVSGILLRPVLLRLLAGSNADSLDALTLAYAGDYMTVILIGAPFLCMSCVLNNQLRFQGNAFFSMIGLVSGAIINCALDPLMIFVFDLKVAGAALATVLSQFISCALLFAGTLRSDSLKIHIRKFRPTPYYLKNIAIGGLPSLSRQGLASIATLCLNAAAGTAYTANPDAAIAAFSVVGKIMMFGFSALLGFGQGFQPVCGFNYGARKYGRVREAYLFVLKAGIGFLLCVSAAGYMLADKAIAVFRDDPAVIAIGQIAMRCQCVTFPLMAVVTMTNMLYQNIGRVVGATLLAVARQGLMFIPVVLILPRLFTEPIRGVWLAQPMADFFAFCLAVPLAMRMMKELKQKENGPEI